MTSFGTSLKHINHSNRIVYMFQQYQPGMRLKHVLSSKLLVVVLPGTPETYNVFYTTEPWGDHNPIRVYMFRKVLQRNNTYIYNTYRKHAVLCQKFTLLIFVQSYIVKSKRHLSLFKDGYLFYLTLCDWTKSNKVNF